MNKQIREYTQQYQWLERKRNCLEDQANVARIPTPPHSQVVSRVSVSVSRIPSSITKQVAGTTSQPSIITARASRVIRHSPRPEMKRRRYHVKLADDNEPSEADSDDSTYDSFNEMETDFCKDESDCSDGYTTDGFATMDVVEYEVDDSSDSEDLYTHDSSSGTDDLVIEAVARALFASSSESDSFSELLDADADTEESSDAPSDPELGLADYWTCIKCKNQKNNPMYRYCEKCYQIRKDHFPPRPKHRRKRSALAKRSGKSSATSSPSSSSSGRSHSRANCDEDGRLSRNSSDGCDHTGNEFVKKSNQTRKTRRRTTSIKQSNSAGESCCSSQELSPDEQQSTLPSSEFLVAASASSQETYCSESEFSVNVNNKNSNLNLFEHNYPNSQESVYPNSEEFSQTFSSQSQGNACENSKPLAKTDSQATTISAQSSLDFCHSELIIRDGVSVSSTSTTCNSNSNSEQFAHVSDEKNDSSCNEGKVTGTTTTSPAQTSMKRKAKKRKINFDGEVSDAEVDDDELMAKQFKAAEDDYDSSNGMCMICLTEPKNGAFVHNRFLHVCCCYRCAVKVWNKRKRCPICNSQVKTVLKMFVH